MFAKLHAILTSTLEGVKNQLHASAVLPPGKSPISILNRSLNGLHDRCERLGEGFVAPAVNRNTILCFSSPLGSHRIN